MNDKTTIMLSEILKYIDSDWFEEANQEIIQYCGSCKHFNILKIGCKNDENTCIKNNFCDYINFINYDK